MLWISLRVLTLVNSADPGKERLSPRVLLNISLGRNPKISSSITLKSAGLVVNYLFLVGECLL